MLSDLLYSLPAILIALTVHEYAHARVAYAFGDPTAKLQGRLSLNPLDHIDPIGLLMLIIARFGWAKPVPINPFNFHDRRQGILWVSLAGPLTNFIAGFFSMFLFSVLTPAVPYQLQAAFTRFFINLIIINVYLAVFNLIPLPPLDGSKILASLLPHRYRFSFQQIEPYGPLILILLIITGFISKILGPLAFAAISLMQVILNFLGFGVWII